MKWRTPAIVVLGVGLVLARTSDAASPAPPRSFAFEFDDARLLAPGQSKSSWLHVARANTPSAKTNTAELPLVVFLHGLAFMGQKHLWMGSGPIDLRPVADRIAARSGPFVLAAPSQTKDAAAAKTLWVDFDLPAFVEATAQAAQSTGVRIDRARVFLVGHSGAGCNPDAGIFATSSRDDELPRSILAVDTCLDPDVGRAAARTQRIVSMMWQELEWPRDPQGALRGFYEEVEPERVEWLRMTKVSVTGKDAHNTVVPAALERALPSLLER